MHPSTVSRKLLRAGIPLWSPRKSSSTLHNSFFFFYKADKLISFVLNLLKGGHLRSLLLSQVCYGRRKTRKFHEKTCNSYLKPYVT